MNGMWKRWAGIGTAVGFLSSVSEVTNAQTAQSEQSQPATQATDKDKKPQVQELTLDGATAAAPAPVSPEEDAAYKAFLAENDPTKKLALGEAFAQKYPQSRYRPPVYSAMTALYLRAGQVQKMEEIGDKEIALNPSDVQVLAILAQTLPRSMNGSTPNRDKELAKAEDYAKRAIETTPTIAKPEGITDDAFVKAKAQTLSMAYSGLGLVSIYHGKFSEAITALEQSIKNDPNPEPDPVNYYLLGLANKNASHFDDAIAAFNKCAAIPGQMAPTCKSGAEEAKKASATQLTAPK